MAFFGGRAFVGHGGVFRHGGHHAHAGGYTALILVPLISVLLLIAVIALLFTARYPKGLYDLVIGMDRWAIRVYAYVSLLRDDYPPFRLDLGSREPEPSAVPVPNAGLRFTNNKFGEQHRDLLVLGCVSRHRGWGTALVAEPGICPQPGAA